MRSKSRYMPTSLEQITRWRYDPDANVEVFDGVRWYVWSTGPHVDRDVVELRSACIPQSQVAYLYTFRDHSRMIVDAEVDPPVGALGSNWSVIEFDSTDAAEAARREYLKSMESRGYSICRAPNSPTF